LNDALSVVVSMSPKLKEEKNHIFLLDVLINDDDFGLTFELGTFAKNIKKEIFGVIEFFLCFLIRYDEKRVHNMLALMLNPRFKNLKLNSSFIGCENGVAISKKYDRKSSFLMFLKSNRHLHPLFKAESSLAYIINEDRGLDIFEMWLASMNLQIKLVNKKLFIFHRYLMDAKNIQCPLEWCRKHETMFATIGFLHYTKTWHIVL